MPKKYSILYFGTWGYGRAGLEGLMGSEKVNIAKIFTRWDLESGNPYFNQVYELAARTDAKIVNTQKDKLNKDEFENQVLNSGNIDFVLSCCFDRFFSGSVLKYPEIAAINIHPSILPKYRGVKPLENALVNGEKEIGVSLHLLSPELDGGDILVQKKNRINHHQTFGELYSLQCSQIKDCVRTFFENPEKHIAAGKKQNEADKTFAPRLPFEIADNDTVSDIIQKGLKHKPI